MAEPTTNPAPVPPGPATGFNINSLTKGVATNVRDFISAVQAQAPGAQEASLIASAQQQAVRQEAYKQPGNNDWRVRLQLAPNSDYLYTATDSDVLKPLKAENGIIFPYTPTVSTAYKANYESYDLIHSNFRGVFYKSSRVDDVSLKCKFTAQDTSEAEYLLAVIHFFRSVTKMFYGQDGERGTPPPLVYLSGFGDYHFNDHPCVVSAFNLNFPSDVDYIRARNFNNYGSQGLLNRRVASVASPGGAQFAGAIRLANALLPKNAQPGPPVGSPTVTKQVDQLELSTYVPTSMEIDITLIPVQARSQVSNNFSLKDFANGALIKGGYW